MLTYKSTRMIHSIETGYYTDRNWGRGRVRAGLGWAGEFSTCSHLYRRPHDPALPYLPGQPHPIGTYQEERREQREKGSREKESQLEE